MALFDITPEDVARGTLVRPGWYPAEVTKVEDGLSKSKGKPKTDVHFKILEAEDHQGEKVNGVPAVTTFSPEYPSFAINFLNALGANIGKDGKTGVNLSDDTAKGKRLMIYIKNDEYEGKMNNKVADYRPLDS